MCCFVYRNNLISIKSLLDVLDLAKLGHRNIHSPRPSCRQVVPPLQLAKVHIENGLHFLPVSHKCQSNQLTWESQCLAHPVRAQNKRIVFCKRKPKWVYIILIQCRLCKIINYVDTPNYLLWLNWKRMT